jgi:hypothetical protein
MIEADLVEKLRAIKERTGLSESEQIRQGVRWWIESREWPVRNPRRGPAPAPARATRRTATSGQRKRSDQE